MADTLNDSLDEYLNSTLPKLGHGDGLARASLANHSTPFRPAFSTTTWSLPTTSSAFTNYRSPSSPVLDSDSSDTLSSSSSSSSSSKMIVENPQTLQSASSSASVSVSAPASSALPETGGASGSSMASEVMEEIPWRNRREERKRFLDSYYIRNAKVSQQKLSTHESKKSDDEVKSPKLQCPIDEEQPGAGATETKMQISNVSDTVIPSILSPPSSAPVRIHMPNGVAIGSKSNQVATKPTGSGAVKISRRKHKESKNKNREVLDLRSPPRAIRQPRATTLSAAHSATISAPSSSANSPRSSSPFLAQSFSSASSSSTASLASSSLSAASSSRNSHRHSNSSAVPSLLLGDVDRQSLRLALQLQEEDLKRAQTERAERAQRARADEWLARREQEEIDSRVAMQLSLANSPARTRSRSQGDRSASSASAANIFPRSEHQRENLQNVERFYAQAPAEARIVPMRRHVVRQLSDRNVRHAYGVHSHALLRMTNNGQMPAAFLDVDSMNYDQLQQLGDMIGDVVPKVKAAQANDIFRLPVFKYKAAPNSKAESEDNQCSICTCDFEEGDDVKVLPCLHRFHVTEIDKWLLTNEKCPVCRFAISSAAPPPNAAAH